MVAQPLLVIKSLLRESIVKASEEKEGEEKSKYRFCKAEQIAAASSRLVNDS